MVTNAIKYIPKKVIACSWLWFMFCTLKLSVDIGREFSGYSTYWYIRGKLWWQSDITVCGSYKGILN